MRKLATIRKIDAIGPIEGADAIEVATVGGWKVVIKKGEFAVGDLAVYFEIDSWMPVELAPFLSKGKEPREFEGIKGERLRTVKLRGQISQGLLLPIEPTCANIVSELFEGLDVSFPLNIVKWEKAIPAQLAGLVKGNFPTQIPKTDQERVQNLTKEIEAAQGSVYEVTEKLEGSSMTCYLIDGEFGVCSRNLDLKRDEKNAFWQAAIREDIETKMRDTGPDAQFAIQGELIGPGIQGNIYKLMFIEFRVFDVYNILSGEYLTPVFRKALIERMGLKHVPVLESNFKLETDVEGLIAKAEGKSVMGDITGPEREGLVFKQVDGGMTFKAISNKYLLAEK
jgi:RNA ligase (TIGR02306 family)